MSSETPYIMGTEASPVCTTGNLSNVTPSLEREAVYACGSS